MELTDIKNNKGAVTMQVRSIEHLQTWLKRDQALSSELNIKPLDISSEIIDNSVGKMTNWWTDEIDEINQNKGLSIPINYKSESKSQGEIMQLAKKQHMTTDIKKAVF